MSEDHENFANSLLYGVLIDLYISAAIHSVHAKNSPAISLI